MSFFHKKKKSIYYEFFLFTHLNSYNFNRYIVFRSCSSLLNYVPLSDIIKEKKKDAEASHVHPGCRPTSPTCLAFNIMPRLIIQVTESQYKSNKKFQGHRKLIIKINKSSHQYLQLG